MRINEFEKKPLYHGTKTIAAANAIIHSGVIEAQCDIKMGRKPRGALTPIQGHCYLTPNIKYACIYALGGNMVGMDYKLRKGEDRYGFVFVIRDSSSLTLVPDEDEIGHYLREAPDIINGKYYNRHMDNLAFGEEMGKDKALAYEMKAIAERYLTKNQQDRLWHDYEYDIMAIVGKKLMKFIPSSTKQKLVDMGCHVSTPEKVTFDEVWRLDKTKNPDIGFQAQYFFEVAKRIK